MLINTKYFWLTKSESKRPVLFGLSVHLSSFLTLKVKQYKYEPPVWTHGGYGLGVSLTVFDIEFSFALVPFAVKPLKTPVHAK